MWILRRAVGVLAASALVGTGLVTGAVPASADRGTLTGSSGDVQVTATLQVPNDNHRLNLWMYHNGTGIELSTAMVSVTGPSGEVVYSRETSFERMSTGWTATDFDLPPLELGQYLLSFDGTATVQSDAGPVDVRLDGTDVLAFYQRVRTVLTDFQATPQNLPSGEKTVVSGIAVRGHGGSPLTGEYVRIWFEPAGTGSRVFRGSARVDDRGYFQKTVTAASDGRWRAKILRSDRLLGSAGVYTAQETRSIGVNASSGEASARTHGYRGGVRIVAKDVVVGLKPVNVRFDAGVVGFGWARSLSNVWLESRRGEGKYPNGVVRTAELDWNGPRADHDDQSTSTTARISALMPAGLYDVGIRDQHIAVCTAPEPRSRHQCVRGNVVVNDRTVTTMRVKRASSIDIAASSRTLSEPKMITLRGSVRKVRLVGSNKVVNRLASNTRVDLYLDPSDSRGPIYKKTVRTRSDGTFATRGWTSTSGRWIAKYPGTGLQAPAQDTVGVTVN